MACLRKFNYEKILEISVHGVACTRDRHDLKSHVFESAGSSCWRYRHHESAVNSRQRGPAPEVWSATQGTRRCATSRFYLSPTIRQALNLPAR
ncbi:MAG: hypothetical protein DI528_10190 [Shinella sp.]|nr:MAG: hypothetical protein DI528_10190 [Shinella sp.]